VERSIQSENFRPVSELRPVPSVNTNRSTGADEESGTMSRNPVVWARVIATRTEL
jgi:hypothetical protein